MSQSSQGKTVDRVLVAIVAMSATSAATQATLYVAASRGRESCTLFTDDKDLLAHAFQRSSERRAALEFIQSQSKTHPRPFMKKPQNPPPEPPKSPFQQLGWLRLLRGSIHMIALPSRGVELILSNALSICIPSAQIRSLGFKSNSLFSLYLEMGADFPTLTRFTIQPTRNFLPIWVDSWPDGKKPSTRSASKEDRPEDGDTDESNEDGGSQSPPPTPPVPLPLPPFLPPGFPPRGGGGRTI